MFDTISFERLLEVTAEDLTEIRDNLGAVYMDETINSETKNVALATAFNTIDSWSSYFGKFKEIQESKLDELNRANASLVNENKKLASENSKLKEDLAMLNEKMNNANYKIGTLQATLEARNDNSNMIQVDIVEMIESLEKAVNLIEENAKTISTATHMKNRHIGSGDEHPAYRQDVDSKALIDDYQSGKLNLKELAEKYDMTSPGLRDRLIKLGVYKSVYKSHK